MNLGYDTLAKIRLQVLNYFSNPIEIEDIIFNISYDGKNPNVGQTLLHYKNLKSLADKNYARKQVVNSIINHSLSPELSKSDELFLFSFDVTYNVDYCFHFDFKSEKIHLIIYRKDGKVVFSGNYDPDFDERPLLYSEVISTDLFIPEPNTPFWKNIDCLYHITDVKNINSIATHGLLAHSTSHSLELTKKDISNQLVQDRRKHIHNKVPLYFNILNPMTFSFTNNDDLVVIEVDKKIMLSPGLLFTDGNAASSSTNYFTNIDALNQLDWNCIFSEYWSDYPNGKRIRCAEVLIPETVPTKYFKHIYTKNGESARLVTNAFISHPIKVTQNADYFF